MEYFIKETEKAEGPYDMMAIIRKVRNGSVHEDTPIATTIFEEPKPAKEYKELRDFFNEDEHEALPSIASFGQRRGARNLKGLLTSGAEFLKHNQFAAVYSGLFMIVWLVLALVFMSKGNVALILVGVALCYFIMGGYLFGILRYMRGNPVTGGLIIGKIAATATHMGVVSLVVATVMFPGVLLAHLMGPEMLFISMPILFIFLLILLTCLSFAPLLITDKGRDFWDAMRGSLRVITMNKGQHLGNVFALVAMNFILLPLMPVVLPITMGALVELYDEHFE